MLSIQEIVDKTQPQLKQIEATMDSWAQFHPDIKTPEKTRCTIFDASKPALNAELKQSLHAIPLKEILVSGIAGAAYLVPDKLHEELIFYSKQTDICPLIGRVVSGWQGGNLNVTIVERETYTAKEFVSAGAEIPDSTVESVQATITPKSFAVNAQISNDMLENAAYDLIEYHISKAAQAIGTKATSLALTVLATATDGVGTLNSALSGDADETKFTGGTTTDLVTAIRKLGDDKCTPNTIVCTNEVWGHSLGVQAVPAGWTNLAPTEGYTLHMGFMDVLLNNSPELHDSTDDVGATMTNCITLIFDRNNAILTGRKRWLRIDNYANPIEDISGAVISARQDSVTLYNDNIYKITET